MFITYIYDEMKRLSLGLLLASISYAQASETDMTQVEDFWSRRHERRDLSDEILVSET